jgi:hypothetical protein
MQSNYKVHTRKNNQFLRLVSIPTPGQPPEEIFKECCYTHLTLADQFVGRFKNDYSAFFSPKTNFIGNGGIVLYR